VAGLFDGLCSVGGLLDGCSMARGVEKPHSESCHQRNNNHHAEQKPGYIRCAELSDPWHMANYIRNDRSRIPALTSPSQATLSTL
jgi:hypothetical protein